MNKMSINLKDFFVISASLVAIIISAYALREASRSNILDIEPIVSVYYEKEIEKNVLEFSVINNGNIDVKDINVDSITSFLWLGKEEPQLLGGSFHHVNDFLGVNKAKYFSIDLEREIDELKKTPEDDDPFFVETMNGDRGRGGLFLVLIIRYRRILDSKLFKKASYLSIVPMEKEINVHNLERDAFINKKFLIKLKDIVSSYDIGKN